jgi:hypothetical protein
MSIKESSATALVRFTGLGIICFNKEKGRGEIAVIRDEKHSFSIKIQQPRFKDGIEKDLIVYENIAVFQDLPKKDVMIEIKANQNAAIDDYEIYTADGDFQRPESEDFNDFRWIVDMNDLHGENIVANSNENRYPITKLFIGNGLFYAHKLDTNLYFEKIEKDAQGNELSRDIFGNVAETIGVKVEADEVLFNLKIGGMEESHKLVRVPGLPFRIEIANMDYDENAVTSDMPDYYKYLASESGASVALETVKDKSDADANSGDSVNFKVFCHPIIADIASIEELEK